MTRENILKDNLESLIAGGNNIIKNMFSVDVTFKNDAPEIKVTTDSSKDALQILALRMNLVEETFTQLKEDIKNANKGNPNTDTFLELLTHTCYELQSQVHDKLQNYEKKKENKQNGRNKK